MKFFRKKSDYKNQLEELEKTKSELIKVNSKNLELVENNINSTREFYERMRNHGIRRFDNFLNLALIADITNTDLSIFTTQIRLAKHRFEKLLYARMLALVIVEYLKDINELLGFKLVGELNANKYGQYIPAVKEISKQFANLRKEHEKVLTHIRNNISAHKTKEALNLVQFIYNLDPNEIHDIGLEIIKINTNLNNLGTEIIYTMISEAEDNKRNSK